MALFSGLLVLGLICAFSLCAAAALGWDPALLVLPTLAAALLALFVAGCLELLAPGLWLVLALLLLGAVYTGVRAGCAALRQAAASPGFLLFAAAAVFFWVALAIQQPMFTQWDEFSAWGLTARMVKENNAFYVAHPHNLTPYYTLPGISLIGYLFHAFAPHLQEWAHMAAVDTLAMACAAAAAAAPARRSAWPGKVLAFAGVGMLPLLINAAPVGTPSSVYLNIMADAPIGFLFGGALALFYALRGHGRHRAALLLVLPPLALLTLLKDIAFAYALIAAFLMALDVWLCTPRAPGQRRGAALLRALGMALAAALAVVAAFAGWNAYTLAADTRAVSGGATVGGVGLSYAEVLFGGVRQLLGIGRTPLFGQLMAAMGQAFFTVRVAQVGSGVLVAAALLLTAVLARLALVGTGSAAARRPLIAGAGLALCFAALYAFHIILYYYIFTEAEAVVLKDYARYMMPYYLGWGIAALALLAQAAGDAPQPVRGAWGTAALAVGTVLLAVLLVRRLPPAGFWSVRNSLYTLRQDIRQRADVFNTVLGPDDTLLILSQGDDSTRWYYYRYELDARVVNGYGGTWWGGADTSQRLPGEFMNLVPDTSSSIYLYPSAGDAGSLIAYLAETGCNYLLVDRADAYLETEFGACFAGGLQETMPATLYRFLGADAQPCFVPAAVAESGVPG